MVNLKYIYRGVAILVLLSLLLPILARNVPLIGRPTFTILAWFGLVFFTNPKLLIAKPMVWGYFSLIVNIFIVAFVWENQGYSGLIQIILFVFLQYATLLTALNMNIYFIKQQDFKGYRIVMLFAFAFILITSITSIGGLERFSHASRTMAAGSASADHAMHAMYGKIGIANYGFYAMAAFLISVCGYYLKNINKIWRLFFYFALVIVIYSTSKAQHTTILLFAIAGFLISIVDLSKNLTLKLAILVVSLAFFGYALPTLLDSVADILPQESAVVSRVHDVADVLRDRDFDPSTSDSYFVTERLGRTEQSYVYFLESPILGSGQSADHAYWIDMLAMYGLLGFIPYLMIFISAIQFNRKYFTKAFKLYYTVAIFLIVVFGIIKNMSSEEIWLGFFFLIPGVYYLANTQLKTPSNSYNYNNDTIQ